MNFSPSTLAIFQELLGQVRLEVSHPDFLEVAGRLAVAKQELADAMAADQSPQ